MIRIKAPDSSNFDTFTKVFLAGSIEQGKADLWQNRVADALEGKRVIAYDPRRESWDSTWVQDPTPGTQFHTQVSWELNHIENSDIVVFYFDPETKSPITLLELGLVLGKGQKAIVCCPDGFYRKGNVVITCQMNGVEVLNSFDEMVEELLTTIG